MSLLASGVLANPSTPYFGNGGGGGGSNTLNNGRRTTFLPPAPLTVTPGAVNVIATTTVDATYDSSSPRYLPLCFAQLDLLEVATTSSLTPGDTVTFYYGIAVDGGGASYSLTPGVTTPASALVGGYNVIIANASGTTPLVLPGPHTYTITLYAVYNSSGSATIVLDFTRQGLITAQVLACAAPII